MARRRIGVLISGRGSNMNALIEAARLPDFPAEAALVISNVADAPGLESERAAGIAPAFVSAWEGRLINIHPSLLPAFKGLDVQQRMIDAGVKIAGCTVHFVSAEMDAGPIIGQAAVPVRADDTAQSLSARILAEEHRLYPECVRRIASGEARLTADGRVILSGPGANGALLNPPVSSVR